MMPAEKTKITTFIYVYAYIYTQNRHKSTQNLHKIDHLLCVTLFTVRVKRIYIYTFYKEREIAFAFGPLRNGEELHSEYRNMLYDANMLYIYILYDSNMLCGNRYVYFVHYI